MLCCAAAMASPATLSVMDTPFCQAVSSVGPELASPSSLLVKDASKRKRVNRNAKLKQCKLDARREQWLSQVTVVKPGKEARQEPPTSSRMGETLHHGEVVHPDNDKGFALDLQQYSAGNLDRVLSRPHLCIPHAGNRGLEDLKDTLSPSGSGSGVSDCFEPEYSPKSPSPKGKVKRVGKYHEQGRVIGDFEGRKLKDGIAGITQQSVGPCSADARKAEGMDHESETDDWEAVADALGLNHTQEAVCFTGQSSAPVEAKDNLDISPRISGDSSKPTTASISAEAKDNLDISPRISGDSSKPTTASISAVPYEVMARSASGRAWRPDDDRRPASLPNLNKQQSLPAHFMGQKQQWMLTPKVLQDPVSGPSLCPICVEELDSTDSSFEPCVCGFQLCLFCHHRIVSDDGRCPGCRRFYKSSLSAPRALASSLY